jgi:hypothetical protein
MAHKLIVLACLLACAHLAAAGCAGEIFDCKGPKDPCASKQCDSGLVCRTDNCKGCFAKCEPPGMVHIMSMPSAGPAVTPTPLPSTPTTGAGSSSGSGSGSTSQPQPQPKVTQEAGCRCPRLYMPVCGSGALCDRGCAYDELCRHHSALPHTRRLGQARRLLSVSVLTVSASQHSCRRQGLQQQVPGRVRQGYRDAPGARQRQVPTGRLRNAQGAEPAAATAVQQAPGLHLPLRKDVQAGLWNRCVLICFCCLLPCCNCRGQGSLSECLQTCASGPAGTHCLRAATRLRRNPATCSHRPGALFMCAPACVFCCVCVHVCRRRVL